MFDENNLDVRVPIIDGSYSIKRDDDKCILCGNCRSVCKYNQGVYGHYDINEECVCIDCGQCSNVCPTSAITEVMDYIKVKALLKSHSKIIVFQTAPAVRVSLGEEFGLEKGSFVQGKMVSLLKKLGADYVFAGNIFETDCKKGLPGRGLEFLENVCEAVNIPVYAIGGISEEKMPQILGTGAAGGCMMSGFMQLKDHGNNR